MRSPGRPSRTSHSPADCLKLRCSMQRRQLVGPQRVKATWTSGPAEDLPGLDGLTKPFQREPTQIPIVEVRRHSSRVWSEMTTVPDNAFS